MLVVCAVSAKTWEISPESPEASDNLRITLGKASTGDVIELADGTYPESNSNYILIDAKNVTIKAAKGAHPIVQPRVPIQIKGGSHVQIYGVAFDASHLQDGGHTDYEYLIYAIDATVGNKLTIDSCEFYNHKYNKSTIHCGGDYKLDEVTISNCYFHDNNKSCMFFENTDMTSLTVTNSTFANIAVGSTSSYHAGIIDARTSSGTVRVDHCTFYNCVPMNNDYGSVGKIETTDAIVSYCIFVMPNPLGSSSGRAIRMNSGSKANYCLTYNYQADYKGIRTDVTRTGILYDTDPQFQDSANCNFTLRSGSPALNVDIGGGVYENLGDPRWISTSLTSMAHDKITYITPKELDFSYTAGLTAYRAASATASGVTMVPVTKVPKNTPLVLIGTAGADYSIVGAALPNRIGTNLLVQGDGTTVFNGTTWDYLLYSDGLFYQIGSGTVATDKAYLHLDGAPSSAAGLRMIFDNNGATDINAIEADEEGVKFIENGMFLIKKNGVVYNALGQVVR